MILTAIILLYYSGFNNCKCGQWVYSSGYDTYKYGNGYLAAVLTAKLHYVSLAAVIIDEILAIF